MLVLSRKIGEKVVIGDNITVVVSRVNGNRVTLGIEAPSEVRIIRDELCITNGDPPNTEDEELHTPLKINPPRPTLDKHAPLRSNIPKRKQPQFGD